MPVAVPSARCPVSTRACPEAPACQAASPPPQERERAAISVLRFLAAARETGDACCWDAALDQAEAAFGERRGPLVVGYAGALIRRLARAGTGIAFLPVSCRRLSAGEALLLEALRPAVAGPLSPAFGSAVDDVAALARSIAPGGARPAKRAA